MKTISYHQKPFNTLDFILKFFLRYAVNMNRSRLQEKQNQTKIKKNNCTLQRKGVEDFMKNVCSLKTVHVTTYTLFQRD